MKKYVLSLISITSIFLFLGAGCASANGKDLQTSAEIQENNKPIAQQIEVKETQEEPEIQKSDEVQTATISEKAPVTPIKNPSPVVQNENKNRVQKETTRFENKDENENESEDQNEEDENDDEQTNRLTPPINNPTPVVTQTPAPATNPTPTPAAAVKTYTMADVRVANNQSKCWSVISGNVYDLTSFTPGHPGGEAAILSMCGKDGTAAFMSQHSGQSRPESILSRLLLGPLN